MARAKSIVDWMDRLLNTGIGGTQFTPLKMLIVGVLVVALVSISGRATRWLVRHVLRGKAISGQRARYAAS
jgi:hypothetical protein